MSDQPERYPYIDDSLEFRTRDGKVWGSVWWPAVHTCALPPGWVTMKTGCPAELVYEGPMPTAQQVWDACDDQPYAPEVTAGLLFLDELPRVERDAFLGLFAGAKWTWTVWASQGRPFTMRKCECQAVEDWRGFYLEKLPAAGLLSYNQTEPYETASGPAYQVEVCPTQLGWDVREAFYERRMRP